MSTEINQAQQEVAEFTGQSIGLLGDLAGSLFPKDRKNYQVKQQQDPTEPTPGQNAASEIKGTSTVLEMNETLDFTQGQIPQDLGIPELRGIDPSKLPSIDRDIGISLGFALGKVNEINENRRSVGVSGTFPNEARELQNIQETRDSIIEQIKVKGYTNEQLIKAAGIDGYSQGNKPQTNGEGQQPKQASQDSPRPPIPEISPNKQSANDESDFWSEAARDSTLLNFANKTENTRDVQPVLDAIDNAPAIQPETKQTLPSLDSAIQEDQTQLETQISEKKTKTSIAEESPKENQAQTAKALEPPKEAQFLSVPTAKTPKEAKEQVKKLGSSIETELKSILKADKVEVRIYAGSRGVYPPKKDAKITPEMADKLNRMFTNPESINGTVRLSLRDKEGKLSPIYQVSDGKVVNDKLGLQKAIAQHLPESKTQAKTQSVESKVENPKAEDSITRQNEINKTQEQKSRRREPSKEEIIASLQQKVRTLGAINAKLKQAQVPTGVTNAVEKNQVRLGDRIKGLAFDLANQAKAKVTQAARTAVNVADNAVTNLETNAVYRSTAFLVKAYGTKQPDGTIKMDHGHRFNASLDTKGNLEIQRKTDGKKLFAGNEAKSRFTDDATMNETAAIKSIPLRTGEIRAIQEKKQHQQQTPKVSGGIRR